MKAVRTGMSNRIATVQRTNVEAMSSGTLLHPGFKSRPRRPAIVIDVFRGFPQSLQENAGIVLQISSTTSSFQITSSSSSFTYHLSTTLHSYLS
jgi:hypothetical protein